MDKERKEQERENMKRKKESDKEIKEKLRKEEIVSKQNKKLISQSTKETKQESKKKRDENSEKNKIRSQYRKDFSNELKKIRGDANASVLQYFDEEENLAEQDEQAKLSTSKSSLIPADIAPATTGIKIENGGDSAAVSSDDLGTFLQSIPSCNDFFLSNLTPLPTATAVVSIDDITSEEINNPVSKDIGDPVSSVDGSLDWDDVFQVANCLYAFNSFLQLQMPIKLDSLIEKIAHIVAAGDSGGGPKGRSNDDGQEGSSNGVGVIELDRPGQDLQRSISSAEKNEDMFVEKNALPVSDRLILTNDEDDEAEWEESDQIPLKSKDSQIFDKRINQNKDVNDEIDEEDYDNTKLLEAQADIDRIHLCLINVLTSDLHSLLDLDESEKSGPAVKFPLNQVL